MNDKSYYTKKKRYIATCASVGDNIFFEPGDCLKNINNRELVTGFINNEFHLALGASFFYETATAFHCICNCPLMAS